MSSRIQVLLPTLLLAVLIFWCGTFHGAATAMGAVGSQVTVLLVSLIAVHLQDPLDLGVRGRWLPAALVLVVALSWRFSPVGRAGLVGLVMLPAYLLLPGATARCWTGATNRALGLVSLSSLTLLVSGSALVLWQVLSLPRPSLPLGHHNLLAGWLILMWPLAFAAIRFPGVPRFLGLTAGLSALATIASTGSFLAAIAVAVQALILIFWHRRWRLLLGSLIMVLGIVNLPRLLEVFRWADLSSLARLSYIEAGFRGFLLRPVVGWGPGSVPWTLGEFMRPEVGIHPASQVVGDLHSLPLHIAYEIGVLGASLVLATAVIFATRRLCKGWRSRDSSPKGAALLGLLGGALFCLGSAPVAIPALMATAAVVAGLTLSEPRAVPGRLRPALMAIYPVVAILVLVPLNRGHFLYDQARQAPSPSEALKKLDRAHSMDPTFPLYLARRAWLDSEIQGATDRTANESRQSARMAPGLAPLWLAAGDLARRAGLSWAPDALSRAHRLDPLSPLPAFHLMTVQTDATEAARLGQAAVTAEPRLAAAQWWKSHPELADRVGRQVGRPVPEVIQTASGESLELALTLDRTPALSFSLFVFRRGPWPGRIAPVTLETDRSGTPNTSLVDPKSGIQ